MAGFSLSDSGPCKLRFYPEPERWGQAVSSPGALSFWRKFWAAANRAGQGEGPQSCPPWSPRLSPAGSVGPWVPRDGMRPGVGRPRGPGWTLQAHSEHWCPVHQMGMVTGDSFPIGGPTPLCQPLPASGLWDLQGSLTSERWSLLGACPHHVPPLPSSSDSLSPQTRPRSPCRASSLESWSLRSTRCEPPNPE